MTSELEINQLPTITFGVIAQLIERFNGIEEVEGLIPSGSTTFYFGCVAQLAELSVLTRKVEGSIPSASTIF